MANPIFTLTGKKPADTYPNLVQFDTSSMNFMDGLGNSLSASTVQVTASYAATASYAFTQLSAEVSASWSSASFSASFSDKSLLADNAASAGYATNANGAVSASHALVSDNADSAASASHALAADTSISASWAPTPTLVTSASFADTTINADNANSAAYADNAGYSVTAGAVTSASWASSSLSSSWAIQTFSSSFALQSLTSDSALNANSAAFASVASTATYSDSGSWATQSFSASYAIAADSATSAVTAVTASYASRADSVDDLYQYVSISPALPLTPGQDSLLVMSYTASAARFIQSSMGGAVPDFQSHVVRIVRDFSDSGAAQTGDMIYIDSRETGSSANIIRASMRDGAGAYNIVFTVDASGSITASRLSGTSSYADNAFSASYAPTVTVGLTETRSWVTTMDTQSMYINAGLVVSWSVQA